MSEGKSDCACNLCHECPWVGAIWTVLLAAVEFTRLKEIDVNEVEGFVAYRLGVLDSSSERAVLNGVMRSRA